MVGDHGLPAPATLADRPGLELLIGIRAENIEADTQGGQGAPAGQEANGHDTALVAETLVVEPLGSHLLVTGQIADQQLKVLMRADAPVKPGDRLHLRPEEGKLRWFHPDTQEEILPA